MSPQQKHFSRYLSQEFASKLKLRKDKNIDLSSLSEEEKEELTMMMEIMPVFQYYKYSQANFDEEFEERVYNLVKDTTDDHFLLLEVISGANVMDEKQVQAFKNSTRFKTVDEMVKRHLKENKFSKEQLMLVNVYLKIMGGSDGTFEYAIQKTYNFMRDVPLFTINEALANLMRIKEPELIMKFVQKVQKILVTTHETFFQGAELRGIVGITIMLSEHLRPFTSGNLNRDFFAKCEKILLAQLKKKPWAMDPDTCTSLLKVLAKEGIKNQDIWNILIDDFHSFLQDNEVNLAQSAALIDALTLANLSNKEFIELLLNSIVEKGYDDEDIAELGKEKAVHFIHNLALLCPDIENAHLLVFIQKFAQKKLASLDLVQLSKMTDALKLFQNLPDKSLAKKVQDTFESKKAAQGKADGKSKQTKKTASKGDGSDEEENMFIRNE